MVFGFFQKKDRAVEATVKELEAAKAIQENAVDSFLHDKFLEIENLKAEYAQLEQKEEQLNEKLKNLAPLKELVILKREIKKKNKNILALSDEIKKEVNEIERDSIVIENKTVTPMPVVEKKIETPVDAPKIEVSDKPSCPSCGEGLFGNRCWSCGYSP